MKNILFVLVALFSLALNSASAQNQVYKKGNINASVGVGLLPTFLAGNGEVNMIPVNIKVGYNVTDNYNVNLYTGFSSATSAAVKDHNGNMRDYENNFLMIGLRNELHAVKSEKFDIYGGFMVGYNKSFIKETIYEVNTPEEDIDAPSKVQPTKHRPEGSKVLLSGFVGGTYFVTPKLGVYGEIGYGVSLVSLGATFKL